MKKAIITGITGQDGQYLAQFLISRGYEVHGLSHSADRELVLPLPELIRHYGETTDVATTRDLFSKILPDEIYHLAGQKQSRDLEEDMPSIGLNLDATLTWLAAIKALKPAAKYFLAGSSEMFGPAEHSPQNELTPFDPRSPYAIGKTAAFFVAKMCREQYGIFAVTGILFNHESPLRSADYVTRKISSAVAKIKKGAADKLELGDLSVRRDWGFAGDYVEAMWMMLQAEHPDDYVIGTGESHSVGEFVDAAFTATGMNWRDHVITTGSAVAATGITATLADPSKIKKVLGWQPRTTFRELVTLMVKADLSKND